jgi:hypothetical protein
MFDGPLSRRIHQLMLTDPDKYWSYDELCAILGAVNKTVSSRCMDLYREGLIEKMMVPSGRPRGRCARVIIKKHLPTFPAWLLPNPAEDALRDQTTQSHHRETFAKRKSSKPLR